MKIDKVLKRCGLDTEGFRFHEVDDAKGFPVPVSYDADTDGRCVDSHWYKTTRIVHTGNYRWCLSMNHYVGRSTTTDVHFKRVRSYVPSGGPVPDILMRAIRMATGCRYAEGWTTTVDKAEELIRSRWTLESTVLRLVVQGLLPECWISVGPGRARYPHDFDPTPEAMALIGRAMRDYWTMRIVVDEPRPAKWSICNVQAGRTQVAKPLTDGRWALFTARKNDVFF